MPSIDPISGRRLSGGAQRKQAAERSGLTLQQRRGVVETTALVPAKKPQVEAVTTPDTCDYPAPSALLGLPEPPCRHGVAAVEAWAADVNLRAAMGLEVVEDKAEATRLVVVGGLLRELAKMKDKAVRAEKDLKLRRLRLGEDIDDTPDVPPLGDPVAILLWSFYRLAALAHDAATAASWQPDGRIAAAKAYAAAGMLTCKAELLKTVARVKKQPSR